MTSCFYCLYITSFFLFIFLRTLVEVIPRKRQQLCLKSTQAEAVEAGQRGGRGTVVHAERRLKQFQNTGQEREDCGGEGGQAVGQFFTVRRSCLQTLVLNPSRSLIPRPGQGRGEGREGGSCRPQRTPPNLESGGSNQVERTLLRCNE